MRKPELIGTKFHHLLFVLNNKHSCAIFQWLLRYTRLLPYPHVIKTNFGGQNYFLDSFIFRKASFKVY